MPVNYQPHQPFEQDSYQTAVGDTLAWSDQQIANLPPPGQSGRRRRGGWQPGQFLQNLMGRFNSQPMGMRRAFEMQGVGDPWASQRQQNAANWNESEERRGRGVETSIRAASGLSPIDYGNQPRFLGPQGQAGSSQAPQGTPRVLNPTGFGGGQAGPQFPGPTGNVADNRAASANALAARAANAGAFGSGGPQFPGPTGNLNSNRPPNMGQIMNGMFAPRRRSTRKRFIGRN